jgi:hypothetical protein
LSGTFSETGIDEAGYAPTLGPMVVTAVSIARPVGAGDLYDELASCIGRPGSLPRRRKDDQFCRLAVGDSKKVYSKTTGLGNLERSVLAFVRAAAGTWGRTDIDLARALTGGSFMIDGLAWYEGEARPLPLEADAEDIERAAARLSSAMADAHLGALRIRSRIVTARDLNRGVNEQTNKADFLGHVVSGLLAASVPAAGEAMALVDRLGGRKDYRPLLEATWPGAAIAAVAEASDESSYTVARGALSPWRCSVSFACRAEERSALVALASMVSKYVREVFVRRLNRWFAERDATLAPTAGYPVDAARFLSDTAALRQRLGIPDADLVRCR